MNTPLPPEPIAACFAADGRGLAALAVASRPFAHEPVAVVHVAAGRTTGAFGGSAADHPHRFPPARALTASLEIGA